MPYTASDKSDIVKFAKHYKNKIEIVSTKYIQKTKRAR